MGSARTLLKPCTEKYPTLSVSALAWTGTSRFNLQLQLLLPSMLMLLWLTLAPQAVFAMDLVYFYASQPGKPTLDEGEGGGNPFASALVDLLGRESLTFDAFRADMVTLTLRKSDGFQHPEVVPVSSPGSWPLLPKPASERRVALVMVYSDYSAFDVAQSLAGARRDAQRVGAALVKAGFDVQVSLDPDRAKLALDLRSFSDLSHEAEVAVLYTTGHGTEVHGSVYLLPGDFPVAQGAAALKERAVRLTTLAAALRAKKTNMVFYAGCRDVPFGSP